MMEYILNWNALWWLMAIAYIPACIGLIVIVLLQKGKGMGFAGAFGVNPGGDTVFGPRGGRSVPVKITYVMATTFMVIALLMTLIEGKRDRDVAPARVDEVEAARINQILGDFEELGVQVEGQAPGAEAATMAPAVVDAEDVDGVQAEATEIGEELLTADEDTIAAESSPAEGGEAASPDAS